MKKYLKIALAALAMVVLTTSCLKDLDVEPLDKNLPVATNVFDSPEAYIQALAKLYASYAVSGQEGPSGKPDIEGIDEGFSNYLRQYWNAQQLSTDEAVIAWNDATIKDFPGRPGRRMMFSSRLFMPGFSIPFRFQTNTSEMQPQGGIQTVSG